MKNIRLTKSRLTDGSFTHAVKFEAKHGDSTDHTVTIECNNEGSAVAVMDTLVNYASFAVTDRTQ